jgi:type VI secretion system Hcp family effector
MKALIIATCCLTFAGAGQVLAQQVFLLNSSNEIPGCSTERGFEEHHPVLSFDSGLYVPFDQSGRVTGTAVYTPIHFLKPTDCSSPLWRQYLSEGRSLDELLFKFTEVDFVGTEIVFFEIELGRVPISSLENFWSVDATQSLPSPVGEAIGLVFNSICWRYLDGGFETCGGWSEPPLSVALIYFDAIPDGSDVHLKWGVSALETVTGYEVLHRPSGTSSFRSLAHVDAVHADGVTEYETTVRNLDVGTHAFRLKEIKFDGTVDYSDVIEVDVRTSPLVYRLDGPYPNPVIDSASLSIVVGRGQNLELAVFDVLGRKVGVLHDGFLDGEIAHRFRLDLGDSPAGLYTLRLLGEDFHTSKTLLHIR